MKRKNVNRMFHPTRLMALERGAKQPGVADMVRAEVEALVDRRTELIGEMRVSPATANVREKMQDLIESKKGVDAQRVLTTFLLGEKGSEQIQEAHPMEVDQVVEGFLAQQAHRILEEEALANPGRFPMFENALRSRPAGDGAKSDEVNRLILLVSHGEQAFRVFPDLAEALVKTKIRAPRDSFHLPYPAFEVLLPPSLGSQWPIIGPDGTQYPAQTALVSSCSIPGPLEIPVPGLTMTLYGASSDFSDENLSTFTVPMLKLMYGGDDMLDERAIREAVVEICEDEKPRSSWWNALRLVINLILYMNAEESDIRPSPQTREGDERDARTRKKGRTPKPRRGPRIYDAGRRVKLPGIRTDGRGGKKGAKIGVRFWVRGHWRNQPYGPGKSKTKLIWIQPHEKGKGRRLPRLYGRQYEAEGA